MTSEAYFKRWQTLLTPRFRPHFLPAGHIVFQFRLEQSSHFYLTTSQDHFEFLPGQHPTPTLTLYLPDQDTVFKLLTGEIDGMAAFMAGQYRADGNIILSQLLLYLFEKPGEVLAQQVID